MVLRAKSSMESPIMPARACRVPSWPSTGAVCSFCMACVPERAPATSSKTLPTPGRAFMAALPAAYYPMLLAR